MNRYLLVFVCYVNIAWTDFDDGYRLLGWFRVHPLAGYPLWWIGLA